jgi:hypothetical protein
MAEVAVPRQMFQEILSLIAWLAGTTRPSMRGCGGRMVRTTMGEVCPDEGGAAGFRALAQAKLQFSTPPARAQRDLPLHGRPDGAIMPPTTRNAGNIGLGIFCGDLGRRSQRRSWPKTFLTRRTRRPVRPRVAPSMFYSRLPAFGFSRPRIST